MGGRLRVLAGSYQVRVDWRFGYDSHLEWSLGYGYVAGYLVFGV